MDMWGVIYFFAIKTALLWIFWTCIPLQMYRSFSRIYTPRSKHAFSFTRCCQTVCENGCNGVHFHQQWISLSVVYIHQHFIFINYWHLCQYCPYVMVYHCDLICISLGTDKDVLSYSLLIENLGYSKANRPGDDCHWRYFVSHSSQEEGAHHFLGGHSLKYQGLSWDRRGSNWARAFVAVSTGTGEAR